MSTIKAYKKTVKETLVFATLHFNLHFQNYGKLRLIAFIISTK